MSSPIKFHNFIYIYLIRIISATCNTLVSLQDNLLRKQLIENFEIPNMSSVQLKILFQFYSYR